MNLECNRPQKKKTIIQKNEQWVLRNIIFVWFHIFMFPGIIGPLRTFPWKYATFW